MTCWTGRRQFLTSLFGLFTLSSGARSQPTRRRVGVLISRPQSDLEGKALGETLLSKLSDAGWRVGHNIDVQIRWCENSDQMRTYTKELVEWPAEVLFAHSAQIVVIAREVTKNTPIVFVVAADPVESGFVNSFAQPGTNATGFSQFDASIGGKRLDLLRKIAPEITRVLVLFTPVDRVSSSNLSAIEAAAAALKINIARAGVRSLSEIRQAIETFAAQTDGGLLVLANPLTSSNASAIAELATLHKLPAIYPSRNFVAAGGLVYYGVNQFDSFAGAGSYIGRVLRGEKVSELPVQASVKFEMVINYRTAKLLGIKVPDDLIASADEVIE